MISIPAKNLDPALHGIHIYLPLPGVAFSHNTKNNGAYTELSV